MAKSPAAFRHHTSIIIGFPDIFKSFPLQKPKKPIDRAKYI
jgi:hypothetical protein